ncbi:hypothetical protein HPB47_013340 [Ixodes persulcatus]|uniref:Uncharacterized protein n=1 Tax=Ixodes persulcatus TaxID=34615 RepID=A0AC60QZP1_IXOPE|nr:hypothetical protein HPB47_013340 [Ixodes persulcatus]
MPRRLPECKVQSSRLGVLAQPSSHQRGLCGFSDPSGPTKSPTCQDDSPIVLALSPEWCLTPLLLRAARGPLLPLHGVRWRPWRYLPIRQNHLHPPNEEVLREAAVAWTSTASTAPDSLAKGEQIGRLESRHREQDQRCKRLLQANAPDDDRGTEAKRKREVRRRQHFTPAEQFPGATARFRSMFMENPFGVTCAVCDRLCFARDVSTIGGVSDEKRDTGACALRQCIESADVYNEPACRTCRESLLKGAVPRFANVNGRKYPPVPEHLPRLNVVEERLVAPRLPFISLRRLRWYNKDNRGQCGCHITKYPITP